MTVHRHCRACAVGWDQDVDGYRCWSCGHLGEGGVTPAFGYAQGYAQPRVQGGALTEVEAAALV